MAGIKLNNLQHKRRQWLPALSLNTDINFTVHPARRLHWHCSTAKHTPNFSWKLKFLRVLFWFSQILDWFCDNQLCCIENKRTLISPAWYNRRVTIFAARFPILWWHWCLHFDFFFGKPAGKLVSGKTGVDIFRSFCPSLL